MTRWTYAALAALLLAFGPGAAWAGPGDGAPPPMGDDDDDDDDDEPEAEPETETEEDSDGEEDSDDEEGTLDLPELSPEDEEADSDEGSSTDEEDAEALDARYRVDIPSSDESTERAEAEEVELPDEPQKTRGLVKVIQKKFFLKYRRVEVAPQIGYIGNDHFIRRLALGTSVGFHINDIIAVEALVMYLPDLGDSDYKALTRRFRNEEEVVPDISRVTFLGVLNVALSPIYGKVELGTLRIINYDIFVGAGIGVAYTKDDTAIIRSPCDQHTTVRERQADTANGCQYVDQAHFVTNAGGGLRIVFNDWIGVRLDARQFTHIEQVYREGDIGLEMKQNFMISLGASLFFPPKARTVPL